MRILSHHYTVGACKGAAERAGLPAECYLIQRREGSGWVTLASDEIARVIEEEGRRIYVALCSLGRGKIAGDG